MLLLLILVGAVEFGLLRYYFPMVDLTDGKRPGAGEL